MEDDDAPEELGTSEPKEEREGTYNNNKTTIIC